MSESLAGKCSRLYVETVADPAAFEGDLIKEAFGSYEEAEEVGGERFVPQEVPYGTGYLRRPIMERRFETVFKRFGGHRESCYARPEGRASGDTYHYSDFRLGPLSFVVVSSPDMYRNPRFAAHRQTRLESVALVLPHIVAERKPDPNAPLAISIKHGKDEIDSAIPQFIVMDVRDPEGVLVWRRNILKEQRSLVYGLLDVRAEKSQDDKGVPKLRRHLRRFDQDA